MPEISRSDDFTVRNRVDRSATRRTDIDATFHICARNVPTPVHIDVRILEIRRKIAHECWYPSSHNTFLLDNWRRDWRDRRYLRRLIERQRVHKRIHQV